MTTRRGRRSKGVKAERLDPGVKAHGSATAHADVSVGNPIQAC